MMDFSIYCQHKSNFVNFLHWAWNTIQRGSYIFTICIPYRHSHLLFSVASSTRSAQGWRFYSVQIKKKQKQNSSEHAGIYIYLTPPPTKLWMEDPTQQLDWPFEVSREAVGRIQFRPLIEEFSKETIKTRPISEMKPALKYKQGSWEMEGGFRARDTTGKARRRRWNHK